VGGTAPAFGLCNTGGLSVSGTRARSGAARRVARTQARVNPYALDLTDISVVQYGRAGRHRGHASARRAFRRCYRAATRARSRLLTAAVWRWKNPVSDVRLS